MSTDTDTAKDSEQSSETLPRTMQALQSVDENAPEAKQNESSITDSDGQRIKLNEGEADDGRVKGV